MKLLSLVRDDPRRPCCEERDCSTPADVVIEFAVGRLSLCQDHLRELRAAIGRQRRIRAINRKQYTALATVARAPGQRATYATIIKAMGRYATNSFNSCVARGLITAIEDDGVFRLTPDGLQLLEHTEAKL